MTEIYEPSIELDCQDNSCMFAKKRTGMRTNGGCRCIPPGNTKLRLYVTELRQCLTKANKRIVELEEEKCGRCEK